MIKKFNDAFNYMLSPSLEARYQHYATSVTLITHLVVLVWLAIKLLAQ